MMTGKNDFYAKDLLIRRNNGLNLFRKIKLRFPINNIKIDSREAKFKMLDGNYIFSFEKSMVRKELGKWNHKPIAFLQDEIDNFKTHSIF